MKKILKRTLASILTVVMVMIAVPLSGIAEFDWAKLFTVRSSAESTLAPTGQCGDNVYWNFDNSTGKLIISGKGKMNDYSEYSHSPFYSNSSIKIVSIESGVTSIGERVLFSCSGLQSIEIPDSVITIGRESLEYCNSLTSIYIPYSVTNIGYYAFSDCYSLTKISVDENNKYYCSDNFGVLYDKSMTKLIQYPIGNKMTEYYISNNVTIEDYAFRYCYNLKRIDVADNNKYFSNDEYGILYNKSKTQLIQYPIGNQKAEFVIPDSVTNIDNGAFEHSENLTKIIIPESVTSIGNWVFAKCKGLASIIIPDSVSRIGPCAFDDCNNLTSIKVGKGVKNIEQKAFIYCTKLKDIYYPGTEEQWNCITIGSQNEYLTNATIHYNSSGIPNYQGEVHAITFDPASSSGIYQITGKFENYTTYVVLNDPNGGSYIGSIRIDGKDYNVKKDLLNEKDVEQLKGKNVICNYDDNTDAIIGISKCREYSDLNRTDVIIIDNPKNKRISVEIKDSYKWSNGKVRIDGGTREITSIPFKIAIYNSIPSEYSDLSDNCKNRAAFDLEVSSVNVSGISNCGEIRLYSRGASIIKLGKALYIEGEIFLPSDFWLGYEDYEKTISAEYMIKLKSGDQLSGEFNTVVKNHDYQIDVKKEEDKLKETANKLKKLPTTAISLTGLVNEGLFTLDQIKYLEKLVLVELAMYTIPEESLDDYVSEKVMEKIFGVKKWVGVSNGKMTIVIPTKYQGRDIQVDIVCDIEEYTLLDRTFGNFTNLTYHAYDLKKNGKREKTAFLDGVGGLYVSADLNTFAEAATDLALDQIKAATKTALKGYEEVEKILFGDTVLKILNAAGYDSVFDFGWELYVNKCKELAYHCPVDIYVYDKDDSLCGAIVNNEVTIDISDDVELSVINDEKIVTLWDDGYYIKTLSNCNGTLNVSAREKGYVNGDVRELTFEDIPLEVGTIYKQGCGEDYYDDEEAYAVEALNGDKINATTDTLSIQPLSKATVTYNANGGSITESSKTVYDGEYVVLPTASKAGYDFIGWSTTNGNTSEFDAGSVLKITGDIALYAIWEKNPVSKPSVKSVSIDNIDLNYKSSAKFNPVIDADSGVKYTTEYKTSDSKIATVDKNGNVYGAKRGSATITCTVTDEYGNSVSDTCTVSVKYTWWQWIIKIVLFGWIWY